MPVFTKAPSLPPKLRDCLKTLMCEQDVQNRTLQHCLDQVDDWKAEIGKIKSTMTVAEWVHTYIIYIPPALGHPCTHPAVTRATTTLLYGQDPHIICALKRCRCERPII